jgi:hypothetical protein
VTSLANDNGATMDQAELQAAMLHGSLQFLLTALWAYEKCPDRAWWERVQEARQMAETTMRQLGDDGRSK